jgi:trigger factor
MTKINRNIKKLPKSEIEIEAELNSESFELYFDKALNKIGAEFELDGFRKGKVPLNILLSKVPEIRILEEMAQMAIEEHYPKILQEENLDVISQPEISITKLARKNPLNFKIKTTLMPEIKLSDYKKSSQKIISEIKPEEKDPEVTLKEIEDTIMDIRKSRAPKVKMPDMAKPAEAEVEDKCQDENCQHEHANTSTQKIKEEKDLPELNDEFVKSLGPFKDVEDFKTKLKENIKLEKQNQLKEKTRLKIVEKIIEESQIEIPEILIEIELNKILYRMESDIAQMGLKFEDYLKHLNKTIDDLKKEFRNDAEKKAKLSLILNEIAKIEKISPDLKQVEKEIAMILEHYKEADPERAKIHVENVLTNEAVFQFLENSK